jgi:hypothetical protein
MSAPFRLPLPTGNWVRFLLAPALIFVSSNIDRNYQTDLWHHLARGRAIVTDGHLLDSDRFTYTVADRHFQDNNWLWQVTFYEVYALGGLNLVQTVNAAILFLAMTCLVLHAWRRGGSLKMAAAVGVLTFLGVWQLLIVRPQTASFLLFIGLSWLLDEAQTRRWLLVFPPFVMALWANLHGGFPTGLLLIGCYALAPALQATFTLYQDAKPGSIFVQLSVAVWPLLRATWPSLLCLAASLLATGANPYGYHVYEYVRHTSGVAPARQIQEWLPPGMHLIMSWFWVLSVLLLMLAFACGRRRPTVQEFCLIFCFLPLACGAVRMVAWWMFICAPILAAHGAPLLATWRDDEADDRPRPVPGLAALLMLLVMILSLPWLEGVNPFLRSPDRSAHREEYDLADAVSYLKGGKSIARLYSKFEWGEYFAWSQWDGSRVFMDGRIEIFPDPIWDEYWAVRNARADWQDILDRYGVDYLVLETMGFHKDLLAVLTKAESNPRWREVYRKGAVVIFARNEAGPPEPRPLGSGFAHPTAP